MHIDLEGGLSISSVGLDTLNPFFEYERFSGYAPKETVSLFVPFRQKLKHSRGTQFPLAELILQISVHISLNPRWISLDWTLL